MSTPKRNDFTDSYLQYYSREHVWHETHMFFQAAAAMLSGVELRSLSPGVLFLVQNATVEVFGLHLRNLFDFFWPPKNKKPQDTDVIAADFFDEKRLPDDFPKLSPLAASARVRANKELAHLTTERKHPADPTKPWPVHELAAETAELVKHFVQGASPSKLNSSYTSQVRLLLR